MRNWLRRPRRATSSTGPAGISHTRRSRAPRSTGTIPDPAQLATDRATYLLRLAQLAEDCAVEIRRRADLIPDLRAGLEDDAAVLAVYAAKCRAAAADPALPIPHGPDYPEGTHHA